jgi:hypothetical protein
MSCALTAGGCLHMVIAVPRAHYKTAEARLYIVTSRAAETGGMIAIRISLKQATEKFIFIYRQNCILVRRDNALDCRKSPML